MYSVNKRLRGDLMTHIFTKRLTFLSTLTLHVYNNRRLPFEGLPNMEGIWRRSTDEIKGL